MGEIVGRITPSPQRVLDRLIRSVGPVDCWELLREIDARSTTTETVTLRVYIHRLRESLGPDAIKTIRGKGYALSNEARQRMAG